jgi:hypothetical protein
MTDLRTAAQQALEALEFMADEWGFTQKANRPERWQAIEALRAALTEDALQRLTDVHQEIDAVLEQEPVAWCDIEEDGTIHGLRYWSEPGRREHALFTHPPRREWQGLTEKEAAACWFVSSVKTWQAIEAALKEKNHDPNGDFVEVKDE